MPSLFGFLLRTSWGGGGGGSALEKKISLVRWATVCSEKSKGGIGLKSFSKLNKALLCK